MQSQTFQQKPFIFYWDVVNQLYLQYDFPKKDARKKTHVQERSEYKKTTQWMVTGLLCLFAAAIAVGAQALNPISWSRCLAQKPGFYADNEAVRIADNVLLYQRNTGGWRKNWAPKKNVLKN